MPRRRKMGDRSWGMIKFGGDIPLDAISEIEKALEMEGMSFRIWGVPIKEGKEIMEKDLPDEEKIKALTVLREKASKPCPTCGEGHPPGSTSTFSLPLKLKEGEVFEVDEGDLNGGRFERLETVLQKRGIPYISCYESCVGCWDAGEEWYYGRNEENELVFEDISTHSGVAVVHEGRVERAFQTLYEIEKDAFKDMTRDQVIQGIYDRIRSELFPEPPEIKPIRIVK